MTSIEPRQALAGLIATELKGVCNEIRSIDLVDLVSYVRFARYRAIEDLLQSSTELFFREGTLTFGWTAAVEIDWDDAPAVTLGMEFRNGPVSVFFDLNLRAATETVEVVSVLLDPPCESILTAVRMAEAFADARVPPRPAADLRHPRDGVKLAPRPDAWR